MRQMVTNSGNIPKPAPSTVTATTPMPLTPAPMGYYWAINPLTGYWAVYPSPDYFGYVYQNQTPTLLQQQAQYQQQQQQSFQLPNVSGIQNFLQNNKPLIYLVVGSIGLYFLNKR